MKRKTKRVRLKAPVTIRWKFPDGDMSLPLADAEKQLLQQAAAAAVNAEPSLRRIGRTQLERAGERLAEQGKATVQRKLAADAAVAANKRRGEKTRERIAKTGKRGKISYRHLRRIDPKKK